MAKAKRKPFSIAFESCDFEVDHVKYYLISDSTENKYYASYTDSSYHEILRMVYKNAQLEHRINELEQKLADIVHFNKLDDNSGL